MAASILSAHHHLALAWGGGGLQDMVTQDEIVLHGRGEGGPDPMQDILHDSFEKQAFSYARHMATTHLLSERRHGGSE